MGATVPGRDGYPIPRFVAIRFYVDWAIWDNLRGRVSDGMYRKSDAVRLAAEANELPEKWDCDWYDCGSHFIFEDDLPTYRQAWEDRHYEQDDEGRMVLKRRPMQRER